jgi:hypothetical protein
LVIMKTMVKIFLDVLVVTIISFSLSKSQEFTLESIPGPLPNLAAANLYAASGNSLYVVGLSDSLTGTSFDEEFHFRVLFLAVRNPDGFSGKPELLDSGYTMISAFSGGMDDRFNSSLAIDSSNRSILCWAKQRIYSSDIIYPRIFDAPQMRCVIRRNGSSQRILEYHGADNPQLTFDQANVCHLVWQSVAPLYPRSPSRNIYGPDSNYYLFTSKVVYTRIRSNDSIERPIEIGRGFSPRIHTDKSGTVHLLWLRADSSNSTQFQLLYSKLEASGFDSAIVVCGSVPTVSSYSIYGSPPEFDSFIDDSGNVYAAWTDNRNYNSSTIYLATVSHQGNVSTDSIGGLALWGTRASFLIQPNGLSHVLWQTYQFNSNWVLHYSQGSLLQRLFSNIRTFNSLDPYFNDPLLVQDSRGIPSAVLTDNQKGVGCLKDLNSGSDTVLHFIPGSIVALGFDGPLKSRSIKPSVAIDNSDQLWIVISHNGLGLLKIQRRVVGVANWKERTMTFSLAQNYPNPFNPQTIIRFDIAERTHVVLSIYDILGRKLLELVNDIKEPGRYEANFNAYRLPSGLYFCRMRAGAFDHTTKMVLLK